MIEGSVFLIDDHPAAPVIRGRVDMGRARIGGQFLVRNATLEATGGVPVGSAYSRARIGGTAVSAPRLSVGAELTLEGACRVTGGIDLSMSELSSRLRRVGVLLAGPGRTALDLTNAELLSALTIGPGATVQGTHGSPARASTAGSPCQEPASAHPREEPSSPLRAPWWKAARPARSARHRRTATVQQLHPRQRFAPGRSCSTPAA